MISITGMNGSTVLYYPSPGSDIGEKNARRERVAHGEHFSISSKVGGRMSILPSAWKQNRTKVVAHEPMIVAPSTPITLGEGSLLMLALVRVFFGYLWFQQLFWKLPPDFAGLHSYVVREGQYTFIPGYAFIIQHVFLSNFILLGAGTWIAEFLVSMSLLFGVFSRLGALLALVLALQLYIGLAVAPGEWYWTYGMIVLLAVVFVALPAGRRLGIDQWLAPRLYATTQPTRFMRLVRWFV